MTTNKRGIELLHDPSLNKSTAFTEAEKQALGIAGLVPDVTETEDVQLSLTSKEFKLLAYLIKNPRRVISRGELLNEVWGYENYPCTRTVDNHILKLRKQLESEPGHPKHFRTVHCAGYSFLP
jgi:DNA-binding response OmpR family regulator